MPENKRQGERSEVAEESKDVSMTTGNPKPTSASKDSLLTEIILALCRANLGLSTALSLFLTRAITSPTLITFIIGWPASELVHFIGFAQALNLYILSVISPSIYDGLVSKVMLALNFFCFSKQAKAFTDLVTCRNDFSAGLSRGNIAPRAGQKSNLLFLASLLPLWAVGRRWRRLQRFTEPYCSIEALDPSLVERWKATSKSLRRSQSYVGRDSVMQWTSLDVTVLDPLPPPGSPVVIYIHGGGWTIGSKYHAAQAALSRIASRGIVTVSINYRLAPERAFPTQILDCKRALIYVKNHCRQWHGDPNKIFVCGESAGGHLTALVGTTPNLPEFQPPETVYQNTSIAGAIPLYGIFDWTDSESHQTDLHPPLVDGMKGGLIPLLERTVMQKSFYRNIKDYQRASPIYHVKKAQESDVDPKFCPFMVVHGTRDALAPYAEGVEFFNELQKVRAKFSQPPDVFVGVNGGHHGFGAFVSPFSMALADSIVDFVYHHAKKYDVID